MHMGSCLCGSVQYQIDDQPFDCCYCHCSICRKLTGSEGGAYGSVKRSDFSWLNGEPTLNRYSPTEYTTRYFCSACGSFLLTEHDAEPENVFISLGTLDTPIATKPQYRQFVKDAPAWVDIQDDLPTHRGWPE